MKTFCTRNVTLLLRHKSPIMAEVLEYSIRIIKNTYPIGLVVVLP